MSTKLSTFLDDRPRRFTRDNRVYKRCSECCHGKSGLFTCLSPEDMDRVHSHRSGIRQFPPKTKIYLEGDPCEEMSILCAGWVTISKSLFDGSRQILDFALPGDVIGFPSSELFDRMDHAAEAVTEVALCMYPARRIRQELRASAALASSLVWVKACEQARAYEHIIDLGRRDAHERVAHLLLELFTRLRSKDAGLGLTCEFPLTQSHMADALGLSTVHINRVLRQLRERGIAKVADHTLTILDLEALEELCDYDDTYLYAGRSTPESVI